VRTRPTTGLWYHTFDQVYDAFHASLCRGARRLLGARLRRRVAEEDIVQSVFRTFYRRDRLGECEFDHTGALGNYLWTIMSNKVRTYAEHHHAQKRDLRVEQTLDASCAAAGYRDRHAGPEDWAMVRDEIRILTKGFVARDLEILRLYLEGYASSEVAQRVGCSRWTVRRIVDGFGHRLQQRSRDNLTAASAGHSDAQVL